MESKIIFNNSKELSISTYVYSKQEKTLRVFIDNSDMSGDELMEFLLGCDISKFTLIFNCPNKTKKLRFVNYKLNLCERKIDSDYYYDKIYFSKKEDS